MSDRWDRLGCGIDRLVSRTVRGSRGAPPPGNPSATATEPSAETAESSGVAEPNNGGASSAPVPESASSTGNQGDNPGVMEMSALDPTARLKLDDQDVKLVPYSIVSVKRGFERYIWGASVVVVEPMTQESFVAWVISKLYKDIANGSAQPEIPPMPDEGRYLRVDFAVTHRWPRESLDFEVKQLRRLEGIYACLVGEFGELPAEAAIPPPPPPAVKPAQIATLAQAAAPGDAGLARAVLGELTLRAPNARTTDELAKDLEAASDQLQGILNGLVQAGLVTDAAGRYRVADRGPARTPSNTTA